ncbi:unnamed protein product [Symbiodinium microadriaticum]|nr:unnamed protein product [Symbiodinium microadriaticum]
MIEAKQRELEGLQEGGKPASKRLIADPSITVDDLAKIFGKYLEYKGSRDLWSLISPPPGGPSQFHWHTPVNGDWTAKVSGLLFDLLDLAPNTKLLGTQVIAAFRFLHANKNLMLPESRTQSHLDKMDMAIRLLMSFLRQLKVNDSLRARVTGASDLMKINLCLEKIQLPSWYQGEAPDMVPPAAKKAKQASASRPVELPSMPSIFDRILGGRGKTQHEKPKAPTKPLELPSKKTVKGCKPSDLLVEAMNFVPRQVSQATGKKTTGKNPVKAMKAPKATKVMKKVVKSMKKKTPMKPTKEATKEESKQEHKPKPKAKAKAGSKNLKFESEKYGLCKLEMYSEKSYIRQVLPGGGFKSIVSCCQKGVHADVVRQLVPHVEKGLTVPELYKIREGLLSKL